MDDIFIKQLESVFDLPVGSLSGKSKDELTEEMVNNIVKKTDTLSNKVKENEMLSELPKSELVKNGISLEKLEEDRTTLRIEAFEVYRIGKALLMKLYKDIEHKIGVNDRMYVACAKMLDSVNNSLIKLFEMNQKLKQEIEFKMIDVKECENDKTKQMTTEQWIEFVKNIKKQDSIENKSNINNEKIIDVN